MRDTTTQEEKIRDEKILTIPNLISLFRLLLIPVFIFQFVTAQSQRDMYIAAAILAVSALSDLIDGKIARHFHQITRLGVILDPVADKLTHISAAVCLSMKYPLMYFVTLILILKEGYMLIKGVNGIRSGNSLQKAEWFGKACTVVVFCIFLFLMIVWNINRMISDVLIIASAAALIFSWISYIKVYKSMS